MSRQDRHRWFFSQFRRQIGVSRRQSSLVGRASPLGSSNGRRLRLEALEDRRLLAVFSVSSVDNAGEGSLRRAVNVANAAPGADTIHFAGDLSGQTIYLTSGDLDITDTLTIDATALAENVTIDANHRSRVINFTASSGDLSLKGLTLQNGRTTGDNANFFDNTQSGGGILFLSNGRLTLTSSALRNNGTSGFNGNGGGIFTSAGAVTLLNSSLTGNSTTGDVAIGGGILTVTGDVTLIDSAISGNSTAGYQAYGGGIATFNGNVTITSSTLANNSTAGDEAQGGAVFVETGAVTINNSTLSGNHTEGTFAKGGTISNFEGSTTFNSSTLRGNSTTGRQGSGGVIYTNFGDVTVHNSTLSGNSTAGTFAYGGGIAAYSGLVTLDNSTLSGNSTAGERTQGGAISIKSTGSLAINSSTLTGNSTSGSGSQGGGIAFTPYDENGSLTIRNSIVAGNTVAAGSQGADFWTNQKGWLTVEYSLIGNNIGTTLPETQTADANGNLIGSTANSLYPRIGPLADNGGLTETHALLSGSPARNAGDPGIATSSSEFDQRGAPFRRVVGAAIDMGALERQTVANLNLQVDTVVDENDGDYSNGDLSLREAIGLANGNQGPDTVTFDTSLAGKTILLEHGEFEITQALTIDASDLAAKVKIDAQQQSRIFNITTRIGDATLAGLRLTGGRTTADNPFIVGIGFATVHNGGAVRSNAGGVLTLSKMVITGNSTAGHAAFGGAVFSRGDIFLDESLVNHNSTTGDSAKGGGISASNVMLVKSTVRGNSTRNAGGGGIHGQESVEILQSTVSGNSTEGLGGSGGGILAASTSFSLIKKRTTVHVDRSTVSGNSVDGYRSGGGGIFATGDVTITNSTISSNRAKGEQGIGGGIFTSLSATITQSTVTNNRSLQSSGGGLWSNSRDAVTLIEGSILSGNSSGLNHPDEITFGTFVVNNSLIGSTVQPDQGGNNVITDDPKLSPLANNGGRTQTHALQTGSPALDAGDPSVLFNENEFDQRGAPNFIRVAGGRIDIGAYESQDAPLTDLDQDDDFDGSDFLIWQRNVGKSSGVLTNASIANDARTDSDDRSVTGVSSVSAAIFDAELAFEWLGADAYDTDTEFVAKPSVVDEALAVGMETDLVLQRLAASNSEEIDTRAENFEEIEPAGQPRLTDELLERVFA